MVRGAALRRLAGHHRQRQGHHVRIHAAWCCAVSPEIAEVLGRDIGFPMGYTYNGHPTACAVALANLAIIEREGLLDAARQTGAYLRDALQSALGSMPIVGEVRGAGMMLAVELVSDRETRQPLPNAVELERMIMKETGVIVRNCAHN